MKSTLEGLKSRIYKPKYNDSWYNSRKAYERAWFRKDPVPYTGKTRVPHYHGRRSGYIARDVYGPDFKAYGRPSQKRKFEFYICPYNSYYDTKYLSRFRQPARDWKRTKVKHQFMRHKGFYGKSLKDANKEYLKLFPFDPRALEKELYDNTYSTPSIKTAVPMWYNFVPDDRSEFQSKKAEYTYVRDDGDIEYECPHCLNLNMTDFRNESNINCVTYCKVCNKYVDLDI